MSVREEFDHWAAEGKERGMEERHWHTARHVLARMPVESGDRVLDLGTGSGYALRALRERGVGRGYGLDGSPEMAKKARGYSDAGSGDVDGDAGSTTDGDAATADLGFLVGDFDHLPLADDSLDHVFSMEAFYYANDPQETLREIRRVLRPGGTFYCAVNYFEESEATRDWQESISVEMTRWSRREYRQAFRDAGLHVAEQDNVPDREIDIPDESEFPHEGFETREAMVERYRTWGTLLTVGVAP